MPSIDVVLQPAARRFADEVASSTERARIKFILDSIAIDPSVDERTKFMLQTGRDVRMYHDGAYWIIYTMLNDWTMSVIGIGTVLDPSNA